MVACKSNKLLKKQFKYLRSLSADLNIEIATIQSSSPFVFLANVGLLNGHTYEDIFNLFSDVNLIPNNIYLFTNKGYSLVQFPATDIASEVSRRLNGSLVASLRKIIYLYQIAETVAALLISSCQLDIVKLFSKQPEGLKIVENVVNDEEESILLSLINWSSDPGVEHLKNRKVKHYGRRFDYSSNGILDDNSIEPIPDQFSRLVTKWKAKNLIEYIPDQITVNMYEKGQGIPMHIDTHSCCENELVSLSLGSDIVMDFETSFDSGSKYCSDNQHRCSILLPKQSLLILKDQARYAWKHGIACRKFDVFPRDHSVSHHPLVVNERSTRISFTFRKYKSTKCSCDFPEFCDSRNNKLTDLADTTKMEVEYVYKVYDQIAGDFDRTRYKPWPRVKQFLDAMEPGSLLCDIGCGNGKYLNLNKAVFSLGSDTSIPLLEICRKRSLEVLGCNILSLPFRTASFDHVICIAVIHHLASPERRIIALNEMSRILAPNGTGLVYVWALEQVKDGNASVYIKDTPSHGSAEPNTGSVNSSALPVHCNRTEFKSQDVFVPWKDKKAQQEFLRYYHVFREKELENLFEEIPDLTITQSYYDQGNWCVIFKKMA